MNTCKITSGRKSTASLAAALALALPAVAAAQAPPPPAMPAPQAQEPSRAQAVEPPRPPAPEPTRPQRASRERLLEMLRPVTPSWTESVLTPPESRAWAPALTPERMAEVLQDSELMDAIRKAPSGSQRLRTKEGVLRFNADRGELRYVNSGRAADLREPAGALPSVNDAGQLSLRTLAALGLPREQLLEPRVVTQMAGGGRAGSQDMEVRSELYRLVTVQRRFGELPVLVSDARIAVNQRGQIHRVRITWPQLSLEPKMRLVEAPNVLDRAAQVLLEHDVSANAEVRGKLGYVPRDDRDPTVVVPAVLYTVLDSPTPFMFSVPVAEPAENDD